MRFIVSSRPVWATERKREKSSEQDRTTDTDPDLFNRKKKFKYSGTSL